MADPFLENTGGNVTIDNKQGHFNSEASVPTVASAAAPITNVTLTAPSDDVAGLVKFGTGLAPAAGALFTVTFGTPYAEVPQIVLTAQNAATLPLAAFGVDQVTVNGFTVRCAGAPAASQAAGTYAVGYQVVGHNL